MFKLKADPKLAHHYIIGVAVHPMKASPEMRGKMFLKYGPVYFHHNDIKNLQDAALMSVDKVFKTTSKEACEMYDCRQIVVALSGLKMAAAANEATLHHFSSEFEIPEDWWEGFVKNCNRIESMRKQLDESRMPGY